MRIDVLSIFPEYLTPLELSLPGKARAAGLVDLQVHDLRQWTHDRHHTTDDTPYGGGAGMVMKPEPWGEALDALQAAPEAVLVVPTPAGEVFRQPIARELSAEQHLVFACGRYEGIDQRVLDHAATRMRVRELSIGDYVLNGGEVAAMAIIEATIRLLPGFMGNAESLVEESHESGLLEYPSYTKPATWRGLDVPEVLLSGNHGRIAAWRHEESVRRTRERRPDLLAPGDTEAAWEMRTAQPADAPELLVLQRACWTQEALANDHLGIPALHESLDDVRAWMQSWQTWVVRSGPRLVGAVRARMVGDDWDIGRIMVAPDLQGQGLGRALLEHIEQKAPTEARRLILFTGASSDRNLKMYRKAGYRTVAEETPTDDCGDWAARVLLVKTIRR